MGVARKAKAKNFSQTSILSHQRRIPAYVQYSIVKKYSECILLYRVFKVPEDLFPMEQE